MTLELPSADGVVWSVCIRDVDGTPLVEVGAELPLSTASVGKVLLLLETARQLTSGELAPDEPLTRRHDLWVGDSGLWQTLALETLPLIDVAALVGAVSDNLATNVLLERVGHDAVDACTQTLDLRSTALHDRVRGIRTEQHPPTLSTGTAAELSELMRRIATGTAVGPEPDRLVRQWLSANVDQSMVGRAFVEGVGLDPIAHHESLGRDIVVWNKTGTDDGIRADVGAATRGERTIAWSVIANWTPDTMTPAGAHHIAVLPGMSMAGRLVLDLVDPDLAAGLGSRR